MLTRRREILYSELSEPISEKQIQIKIILISSSASKSIFKLLPCNLIMSFVNTCSLVHHCVLSTVALCNACSLTITFVLPAIHTLQFNMLEAVCPLSMCCACWIIKAFFTHCKSPKCQCLTYCEYKFFSYFP